jgi:hypothetical protein
VTSVAYLSDDIIADDVMTRMTRLQYLAYIKGHWEDVVFLSSYFVLYSIDVKVRQDLVLDVSKSGSAKS